MKIDLNNAFTKGLIATLIALLTNLFATSGWPATPVQWWSLLITIVATVLIYFGQSALIPATSKAGQLNGRDFWKGLAVSLGNALSSLIASGIMATHIDWAEIGKLVGSTALLYLGKNLVAAPPKP